MQLSNTFTHQWLGLDKRVSMLMVVLSILSLGLLAYKVASDAPCREVAMAMSSLTNQKTNSFFTNELIHFSAPLEENEKVEWDFGDKSTKLAGAHVTHMFKQAGDYIVTVEINGRCKTTGIVSIKDFVNNANSDGAGSATNDLVKELANPISAESFIIEQGKQLLFSSNVQASSYEWSVEGDLAQPKKTTDKAAYTFLKTGNFTLKLVLNNDPENTWTRVVSVTPRKVMDQPVAGGGGGGQTGPVVAPPPPIPLPKPKPTTQEPEQPRTTTNPTTTQPTTTPVEKPVPQPAGPKVVEVYMDNEQWREMLQDVVSGNASLGDFKMYLNDTEAKMILVDKETISFAELVSRLKDKKIDEKSLQVDQDYDFPNKRLKKLIVKFKKKRGIF